MSEATPGPIEPSTPSAEQLAQWRALVDRIRQGDRSEVVAWDEVVEDGAHEAFSLEVDVVGATPILGGLVTAVTSRQPPSQPTSVT